MRFGPLPGWQSEHRRGRGPGPGLGPPFGLRSLGADTAWGSCRQVTSLSGGRVSSRHSWVRVSGTFVRFSSSSVTSRLGRAPPGLPASPPCPSVSCSPHASHRQTARSILHLPTTGECGPAAARPVRGAGAWGAVSATCVLRGHGGRGSAEQPWLVPRAGVTGGSHVVNGRPVLARGA